MKRRRKVRRNWLSTRSSTEHQKLLYSAGIAEDGRCLFRSLVCGASLRAGKPSPNQSRQKELADGLRARVVDEFIKRRSDTEWFLEGDFDTYTVQMRKSHVWGGEPELLMSSHVLRMPITVLMWDKNSSSLRVIAKYGQEYGQDNPIQVVYNGYGHYDLLKSSTGRMQSQLELIASSNGPSITFDEYEQDTNNSKSKKNPRVSSGGGSVREEWGFRNLNSLPYGY